ncbi:MAG: hypothetical protein MJ189_04185 [Coriobacteriales bacterium]|nr:hypothetical protein [Coriobacteriales bacterium]
MLQHSLNVYDALKSLLQDGSNGTYSYLCCGKKIASVVEETIIIISLFHDLCKTNMYKAEKRNRKKENGEWESYDAFVVEDQLPYGHGEKSVMLLSSFIQLTTEEKLAIRWHMGFPQDYPNQQSYSKAIELYPIVYALHVADMMASKFMEGSTGNTESFL